MADPDITVRNLTLEDVLPVVRICNQAFLEHARFPEHAAMAVRYIGDSPAWQWGAFREGRLAAFLLTEPRPDQKRAAVRLVAADPAVKGRGLGSQLLGTLEARARAEGFRLLSVGTPFAKGFYEKNGFALTATDLRMIREIACQAVPDGPEANVRRLDFAAAAEVLPRLAGDERRRAFLSAFLANVRREAGLMIVLDGPNGPQGVAVGRTPELYRDFAEVVFHDSFGGELAPLVRAFERTASGLGLRYAGWSVAGDREREMERLGYRRSEQDFFWTMYTLEKRLEDRP
jgi:GNAT superfamily N-acetyltransferase